ncbi:MAG TPA: GDSL-type esterase/lipase family protein [Saprospiraceae bacterium]|nr:GDSL-type esterase/lipase family protein [Saprospiraceae bacterium]
MSNFKMSRNYQGAIFCLLSLFLLPVLQAQNRFEAEIRAFEKQDSLNKPAQGQVLLYGSSTMRLWTTFQADLPGVKVVNRGFGGSEMEDAIYFFERVVVPLKPSLILLYEGDNDLANSGKSPERVAADFRNFLDLVKKHLPGARVAVYSIRPSLLREHLMPKQRQLNELFRKICRKRKGVYFIDATPRLLDAQGRPNAAYLMEDNLHLNTAGYQVWAEITRAFLAGMR